MEERIPIILLHPEDIHSLDVSAQKEVLKTIIEIQHDPFIGATLEFSKEHQQGFADLRGMRRVFVPGQDYYNALVVVYEYDHTHKEIIIMGVGSRMASKVYLMISERIRGKKKRRPVRHHNPTQSRRKPDFSEGGDK